MTIPDSGSVDWIFDKADPFEFFTYPQWKEFLEVKLGQEYVNSSGFRTVIREIWYETQGLNRSNQGLAIFGSKLE